MMKKNKVTQKLSTEQIDTPQSEYVLSPEELTRLTGFYSLLIKIDRRLKAQSKKESE
jgi:hypothetical protein